MTSNEYEIALEVAKENLDKINREISPSIRTREESLYENLTNSNLGPLKRLEALYDEMDKIYSFIKRFSPCKKGCNHCCHYEIAVSEVEVEYIKRNIKVKGKIKPQRSKACPFLKNSVCSIYTYRPFLCRRHLSLADSEKWCEEEICNKYSFPLFNFSEVDRCYAEIVGVNGLSSIRDIRDAFPRAQRVV
jgi:Fe-S-cluster containining protein